MFQIYYLDPISLKSYQFCNLFHVESLIYCKNWEKNKENRWNAKRVSFLARSGGFSQPIELGIVSIFISKVYWHKNLSHYKILEKKSFWPNSRIPLLLLREQMKNQFRFIFLRTNKNNLCRSNVSDAVLKEMMQCWFNGLTWHTTWYSVI